MGDLNVDLDQVEDNEINITPPPAGRYLFELVEVAVRSNSKNTGKIFKARAKIIEGEHAGKNVFINLNITHESAEAQKIGRGQFKSLCKACGVKGGYVENSSELFGKEFRATVKTENSPEYGEQARIAYFIEGSSALSSIKEKANAERLAIGMPPKTDGEEISFDDDALPF